MRNIAIFVSGKGEATERVVKLFNEGNRVKISLVFADDSAADLVARLNYPDVTVVHIPYSDWHEKQLEVAQMIKDNNVKLLVLDNFSLSLSDEILEATEGKMIRLSSYDLAPREVVAALEADLKPQDEPVEDIPEDKETSPTPESEWADALKIKYTPPKIPTTPPDVPKPTEPTPEVTEEGDKDKNTLPLEDAEEIVSAQPLQPFPEREKYREPEAPMPSTWLIWSVLVTVFCCFIPGIIAIIFSSQVSSKYYAGDIEGARRSSRLAEIWIIVSVVLGVLSATLYIPFMLIGG